MYILAQAQTCVPIPIPELNPCAQRILQTESSLFSSFNLLSRLSGLHGPFDRGQGPYSAKNRPSVDSSPEHCILVAGGCSNSEHLKPDIVPKLFDTSNSPTGFCSFGF